MAYSWGQIEIGSRRRDYSKKRKKKGYSRKLRAAAKSIDFSPVNGGYKGYQ